MEANGDWEEEAEREENEGSTAFCTDSDNFTAVQHGSMNGGEDSDRVLIETTTNALNTKQCQCEVSSVNIFECTFHKQELRQRRLKKTHFRFTEEWERESIQVHLCASGWGHTHKGLSRLNLVRIGGKNGMKNDIENASS
ncbi:hypothetical protein JHK87_049777 [Glycine soja]|nr:hypothetical protein JHK87_049777 [Glycine soja]